ncbi:OB-fold domain-containing protein [Bacillus sp. FJAT-29953]|nr:OB-fold domain-containing protein [Bacillus sp. FJAT-29953]
MTFPPKLICPNCFSEDLKWIQLSGKGKLYSLTKVWAGPEIFKDELPYTVCIVDLEEGIRVASRLLDDYSEAKPGDDVSIVVCHYTDYSLFCFEKNIEKGR